MKHFFFAFAWMLLSTGAILTSIASFDVYTRASTSMVSTFFKSQQQPAQDQVALLAPWTPDPPPIDGAVKGVATVVEVDDGRAAIVANFLKRYKSPLMPPDHFGQVFVEIADRYDIDFRLLPAIAMQESNLCKNIPEGSYNCLGFGIHARGTLKFENFEANFDRAARELKRNYIDQGLTTPEDIMRKYTPSSNGSWAASVNQWMAEMRYDDRQLGLEHRTHNADLLEFTATSTTSTDLDPH